MLRLALPVVGALVVGCSHPTTVLHLYAPPAGSSWVVRDHTGARLCSLPCKVELDDEETVVVARERGGQEFVVHQEALGEGSWSGGVRVRREPGDEAVAIQALSGAFVSAGSTLVRSPREDRMATGLVLTGIGTVGLLASHALPTKAREELWLERMASAR